MKRRIPSAWSVSLATFGLVAACAGCGRELAGRQTRVALRLLPDGTEELSSRAVFWEEVEVASWKFDSAEAIVSWKQERADVEYQQSKLGLLIRSSSPDPSVYREDLNLDASRVRVIRVRSSALTTDAYMQLFWTPAGEPFTEANSLSVNRDDLTGALVPTYTFPVWRHPGWKGTIGRLRLDPTSVPDRRMELFSVAAIDLAVRDELVALLVGRSWRVDLNGDVRRAVLVPPAVPFVHELKVPPRAVLRVACGLEQGVKETTRFRVVAEQGDRSTTLMEQTLSPCESGAPCRWEESTVDLGSLAGRQVKLRFETESPRPLDLLRGLPAFADLEVVVPAVRRPRPNVILVVLDTLRADRLSLYGYSRPTTPHIDAWARRRGVVFDQVVASAPWTLPSHVTMFTGLDALSHGANTDEPISETLVMLAERLRDAGYTTQAITGGAYLATEYAVMQGFDRLDYYFEPRVHPEESGNDITHGVERALAWLETTTDRPFFFFFHTYEVHSPHDAREPYFRRFHGSAPSGPSLQISTTPKEAEQKDGFLVKAWLRERVVPGPEPTYRPFDRQELPLLQDVYDSSVAYADEQVSRLLERVAQLGLDDETIVVVTSDHGESLGEKGLAGHSSLHECDLMVPLIVALPNRRGAGTRISTQVRLADLTPTILDLLDLEPLAEADGCSLVRLLKGRSVGFPDDAWSYAGSSNFGIGLRIGGQLKYTYDNAPWPPIRGDEAVYRVDRDPNETTNLAAEEPRLAELRERARARYASATSGVRIRYTNRTPVPMAGFLRGRIATPLQIKYFDNSITDVEWHWQTFHFTLPPGQDATFFLEGNVFGEVLVGADLPGLCPPDECLKEVVGLDGLFEPWQVRFDNGAWTRDPEADLERVTGVRLWIAGSRSRRTQEATVTSRELQEQLRNLGYVQ